MNNTWYRDLLWVIAAGILGFFIPTIFVRLFHLPRELFLLPYALLAAAFLSAYVRWSHLELLEFFRHHWIWGLVGALAVGIFTVKNILSQPASPHTAGLQLVFEVLWLGVVYGTVDALLLSVLPVTAVWRSFTQLGWTAPLAGKVAVGLIGLAASLLVTISYHWGFPEFAGMKIMNPVIGNGMMSLGYLLTSNPLAAIFSHVAMHIAGVLHGPAGVVQLPPHY